MPPTLVRRSVAHTHSDSPGITSTVVFFHFFAWWKRHRRGRSLPVRRAIHSIGPSIVRSPIEGTIKPIRHLLNNSPNGMGRRWTKQGAKRFRHRIEIQSKANGAERMWRRNFTVSDVNTAHFFSIAMPKSKPKCWITFELWWWFSLCRWFYAKYKIRIEAFAPSIWHRMDAFNFTPKIRAINL